MNQIDRKQQFIKYTDNRETRRSVGLLLPESRRTIEMIGCLTVLLVYLTNLLLKVFVAQRDPFADVNAVLSRLARRQFSLKCISRSNTNNDVIRHRRHGRFLMYTCPCCRFIIVLPGPSKQEVLLVLNKEEQIL